MKILIFFFLFITFILSSIHSIKQINLKQIDSHWLSFKKSYKKEYNNETHESKRKEIFKQMINKINEQNNLFVKGEITYTSGINEFSDWTPEEFMSYVNKGLSLNNINNNMTASLLYQNESKTNAMLNNLPASIDWRTKGIVNTIKNQGKCGSCWAFSVNSIIESYSAMITKVVPTLSEQNLVDCTYPYDGCGGGSLDDAFDYIINNNGISFGYAYPYVSGMTGRVSVFQ
jgi:cathepsin L